MEHNVIQFTNTNTNININTIAIRGGVGLKWAPVKWSKETFAVDDNKPTWTSRRCCYYCKTANIAQIQMKCYAKNYYYYRWRHSNRDLISKNENYITPKTTVHWTLNIEDWTLKMEDWRLKSEQHCVNEVEEELQTTITKTEKQKKQKKQFRGRRITELLLLQDKVPDRECTVCCTVQHESAPRAGLGEEDRRSACTHNY